MSYNRKERRRYLLPGCLLSGPVDDSPLTDYYGAAKGIINKLCITPRNYPQASRLERDTDERETKHTHTHTHPTAVKANPSPPSAAPAVRGNVVS